MKIESSVAGNKIMLKNTATMLDMLKSGDIIKVQVIKASSNELILRLPDSSLVNAASMIPIKISEGDFVSFIVKAKTDNKIFLETLNPDNNNQNNTPEKDVLNSSLKNAVEVKKEDFINWTNKGLSANHKNSDFIKIADDGLKNIVNYENIKEIFKSFQTVKQLKNESDAHQPGGSIQKDFEFINETNNHNMYLQLPLEINSHKTTGELYILKRKTNKKKRGFSGISVLISLDTENIGRIDALVTVDGKNVSLDVKVGSEKIFAVLKKNYKELHESLSYKGYKLKDFKFRVIDEKNNRADSEQYFLKELSKKHIKLDCKI